MNYNYNPNQSRVSGNCPPRTSNSRGHSGLPYSSMSTTKMYTGNRASNTNMSSLNTYSGQQQQYVYQQQKQMAGGRGRQEVGRRTSRPNTSMPPNRPSRMSIQRQPQPQPLDWQNVNMRPNRAMQPQQQRAPLRSRPVPCPPPNKFGSEMTPAAGEGLAPINVNVTAAMLASANNTPAFSERVETGFEGNPNVKYIPLSWDAILGKTGMNGMKVSMAAPNESDPNGQNQNRQLKISFGGQGEVGQQQAGETPLRVMSFQPVSSGRMDGSSGKGFNPGQSPMTFSLGPGGQPGQNLYTGQGQPAAARNQYGGQSQQQQQGTCRCANCNKR